MIGLQFNPHELQLHTQVSVQITHDTSYSIGIETLPGEEVPNGLIGIGLRRCFDRRRGLVHRRLEQCRNVSSCGSHRLTMLRKPVVYVPMIRAETELMTVRMTQNGRRAPLWQPCLQEYPQRVP